MIEIAVLVLMAPSMIGLMMLGNTELWALPGSRVAKGSWRGWAILALWVLGNIVTPLIGLLVLRNAFFLTPLAVGVGLAITYTGAVYKIRPLVWTGAVGGAGTVLALQVWRQWHDGAEVRTIVIWAALGVIVAAGSIVWRKLVDEGVEPPAYRLRGEDR